MNSTNSTQVYYQRVVDQLGSNSSSSIALFEIPGMGRTFFLPSSNPAQLTFISKTAGVEEPLISVFLGKTSVVPARRPYSMHLMMPISHSVNGALTAPSQRSSLAALTTATTQAPALHTPGASAHGPKSAYTTDPETRQTTRATLVSKPAPRRQR